jgi:hypothetical protein
VETSDTSWLPSLIELEQYGGDWPPYCDALYEAFSRDFLISNPVFRGSKVSAPRRGSSDGNKNGTFWHIVSDGPPGSVEEDRTPHLRRSERIGWIRRVIENSQDPSRVVSWSNTNRGDSRWILTLADFSYMVVLADHQKYMTLITGYPIEQAHRREKTRKEYARASEKK